MELPTIAFLVSGDTGLVSAAKQVLDSKYYAFSVCVIANQDCPAYQRAVLLGFDHFLVHEHDAPHSAEPQIGEILDSRNPTLIITAGYNRILSPSFVEKYRGKLVNFHPSLLPAFAGLFGAAVHQTVLNRGCRISGATVHLIGKDVDTGKIILQKPVAVDEFDTPETLKQKVDVVEAEMLPKLIVLALDGKLAKLA